MWFCRDKPLDSSVLESINLGCLSTYRLVRFFEAISVIGIEADSYLMVTAIISQTPGHARNLIA